MNEIQLENGVSVVARAGARHEIIATGYSEKSNARFRIKKMTGDSKIVDISLTLERKRYVEGGKGLSYYTVVVPSVEKLSNIQGEKQFDFTVEWDFHENMKVILSVYEK